MSELSGLELRKAVCEAMGWRYEVQIAAAKWRHGEVAEIGYFHSPKCAVDRCDYPSHKTLETLPAIESNPVVSEPLFLEWCERNGIHRWEIFWRKSTGKYWMELYPDRESCLIAFNCEGSSLSELRARAILAASRKEQG